MDGFMNASAFLPLSVVRTLPLSFLGAGLLKTREGQIQGGLLVYDSHNVPTTKALFGWGGCCWGVSRPRSTCPLSRVRSSRECCASR